MSEIDQSDDSFMDMIFKMRDITHTLIEGVESHSGQPLSSMGKTYISGMVIGGLFDALRNSDMLKPSPNANFWFDDRWKVDELPENPRLIHVPHQEINKIKVLEGFYNWLDLKRWEDWCETGTCIKQNGQSIAVVIENDTMFGAFDFRTNKAKNCYLKK